MFFLAPKKQRPILLLLASFVFYGYFSVPLLGLILVSSSIDYVVSNLLVNEKYAKYRKILLTGAIVCNLSVLIVFKYANWLFQLQADICRQIGFSYFKPSHLDLILPLGISFYTFEAISYVVDVYRGMPAAKSWWHYNFYIMWFPHLIAGPIVRFNNLSRQYISGIDRPSIDRVKQGLVLILMGYACKLVIADSISYTVDPVWAAPAQQTALTVAGAMFGYASQLYFDFWGYTQVGRGISLLFNIELPINFNHPGGSRSVAQFWQRWHISLSQWLHDYVFLPLGGRTRKLSRLIFAIVITMTIAGIWHGADTKFVALGIYFAASVVTYHLYRRHRKKIWGKNESMALAHPAYTPVSWILCQLYAVGGASFLRSADLPSLQTMYSKLAQPANIFSTSAPPLAVQTTTLLIGLFFFALYLTSFSFRGVYVKTVTRMPLLVRAQAFACVIALCWICAAQSPKPFIYFQF